MRRVDGSCELGGRDSGRAGEWERLLHQIPARVEGLTDDQDRKDQREAKYGECQEAQSVPGLGDHLLLLQLVGIWSAPLCSIRKKSQFRRPLRVRDDRVLMSW